MPCKTSDERRAYQRGWVAGRRATWMAGKSCVDCGSTKSLQLDHRDPEQKVTHRIWSWSLERLELEAAKCDIRCSECHTKRHAEQRSKHGIGGYQRRGCRCEVCKAAKHAANVRERERRGRESDPGKRLCRPSPNHSATAPGNAQLSLPESEPEFPALQPARAAA